MNVWIRGQLFSLRNVTFLGPICAGSAITWEQAMLWTPHIVTSRPCLCTMKLWGEIFQIHMFVASNPKVARPETTRLVNEYSVPNMTFWVVMTLACLIFVLRRYCTALTLNSIWTDVWQHKNRKPSSSLSRFWLHVNIQHRTQRYSSKGKSWYTQNLVIPVYFIVCLTTANPGWADTQTTAIVYLLVKI